MVRKKPIYYKSAHTTQKNFWECPPAPAGPSTPPPAPLAPVQFSPILNPWNMLQYNNIITLRDSSTACKPYIFDKYCNFRT